MAVQVLSDDEKRGIYDRFGEAGLKGGFAGAGAGGMGGMGDFRWVTGVGGPALLAAGSEVFCAGFFGSAVIFGKHLT